MIMSTENAVKASGTIVGGMMAINQDSIIVRQASNDFYAFKIASAMQRLNHVDVIAVVCQPIDPTTSGGEGYRWHVYARHPSEILPSEIDAAIDADIDTPAS